MSVRSVLKAHINYAGELFFGAQTPRAAVNNGDPGLPMGSWAPVLDFVPTAKVANNIALAQTASGTTPLLVNGALASGGVATLDSHRRLEVVSNNAGDTTQTLDIVGWDTWTNQVVKFRVALNGTTVVTTAKAFSKVISITPSASTTGTVTVGTSDTFGLPYRCDSRNYLLTYWNGAFITTGTFTAAVATDPNIITTGDPRGVFLVPDAADAVKRLTIYQSFTPAQRNDGIGKLAHGVMHFGN